MSSNKLLHVAFNTTESHQIDDDLCSPYLGCVLFKSLHFVLCAEIDPTAQECPIVIDWNSHTQSFSVS